ncbi:MAG: DUF3347 domain-containing protein [Planctomycetes bacterium]|nr:DUF3347 domain-containing protein [Planctomycetota bacterium]
MKGIPEAKKELASALEALSKKAPKGLSPKNKDQRSKALEAALAAASKLDGSDLKNARQTFGALSAELRKFVEAFPAEVDAYVLYCDMAKKSWLQDSSKVLNPYYGSAMSECGKVVRKPKTSPPEDTSKGKEKEPEGKRSGHEHGGHSGDHKH